MITFEETDWKEDATKVTFSVRVKVDGVEQEGSPYPVSIMKPITPLSVTTVLKGVLGAYPRVVVRGMLQKLGDRFDAT